MIRQTPSPLETAARAALDSIAKRALTDKEWERWRVRLLEFVTILREWNQPAEVTKECSADKVVTMEVPNGKSILDKVA